MIYIVIIEFFLIATLGFFSVDISSVLFIYMFTFLKPLKFCCMSCLDSFWQLYTLGFFPTTFK